MVPFKSNTNCSNQSFVHTFLVDVDVSVKVNNVSWKSDSSSSLDSFFSLNNSTSSHLQDANSCQILSSQNDCSQNDSEISDINSNSSEKNSDTDSTLRYDDSFSNIDSSETEEVQSLDSDKRTSVSSIISEQKKSGLNIYYTNADNIKNKREELQAEIKLKDPDFVVITEGYPKSISPNDIFQSEFEIKGFERLHGEIIENCRGVFIYYKQSCLS